MRILRAIIIKEFHQLVRDPSCIIIAFVLPLMLLFIYMYGVNLDTVKVSVGIKVEDPSPEIATLIQSFSNSKYMNGTIYECKKQMAEDLMRTKLRGLIIIPNDFSTRLDRGQTASLQVITDGSEVNLANYVQSYPTSIAQQWLTSSSKYKYRVKPRIITTETRYWFNQEINSHYFVVPGSLAITMTLIGMLLTALVLSREWERGTMEALLTTRVRKLDIVLGKYIPYFILGMASMCFNVFVCVFIFKIPFRGNFFILAMGSGLFLLTALGTGLIISSNFKDQFLASQTTMAIGFLPSMLLSGLMFPISSMPVIFQWLTKVIPARYFVMFMQSEFMAGSIEEIIVPNCLFLLILGLILFVGVYERTQMRID